MYNNISALGGKHVFSKQLHEYQEANITIYLIYFQLLHVFEDTRKYELGYLKI